LLRYYDFFERLSPPEQVLDRILAGELYGSKRYPYEHICDTARCSNATVTSSALAPRSLSTVASNAARWHVEGAGLIFQEQSIERKYKPMP